MIVKNFGSPTRTCIDLKPLFVAIPRHNGLCKRLKKQYQGDVKLSNLSLPFQLYVHYPGLPDVTVSFVGNDIIFWIDEEPIIVLRETYRSVEDVRFRPDVICVHSDLFVEVQKTQDSYAFGMELCNFLVDVGNAIDIHDYNLNVGKIFVPVVFESELTDWDL